MKWDEGIAGPHLAIASSTSKRIGVLAGPGTGKTSFGLMRRVARLLAEGVPGSRILLISFTRVAAADLRDKIAALEVPGTEDVKATTLHSYCLGLLMRDAVLAITQRTPRILLNHERDLMLRDIGGDYGDIYDRRDRLKAFEAGWVRGVDEHPGQDKLPGDRDFEAAVLGWLRDHRCMLIGEVVPIAHKYLTTNPAAPELQAFDHIVVDEYQDLNALEQSLLDALATTNASLCIAGDDDQSIYSMRYAHPNGILTFREREETEAHEIWTCGRCPRTVLSMANSLIAAAPHRDKPTLDSNHSEDGSVAIVQWDSLGAEVSGVISAIATDVTGERREPGEILVLTHRRHIGERIRDGLRERGIPAESFFTEEELDKDAAQQALALFRLALQPDDAPALRVLVGGGDGTGRSAAYQRLRAFALESGASVVDVLRQIQAGEKVGVAVPAIAGRFSEGMKFIASLDMDDLAALVDSLFPEEVKDLAALRRIALAALPEATSPKDLFDKVLSAVTQEDVPQHPTFVRIMSLHKSKGLTSPAVFIAGAVEGIVPTLTPKLTDAEREASIDEHRRLLFVAITRAAEQLVISHARRMDLATAKSLAVTVADKTVRSENDTLTCGTIASRYLAELGPDAPTPVRGIDWIAAY